MTGAVPLPEAGTPAQPLAHAAPAAGSQRPAPAPAAGGEPPRTAPATTRPRAWRGFSAADLILALGLVLCYGFFRQHPLWNELSRYDLVQAIVETNSLTIDPYEWNTGDKAYYDGHYYSDKAPGTALLGVPVERLLRLGYTVAGLPPPDPEASIHALSLAVSGIPTVLVVLLLLRLLRPAVGRTWALVVGLGYGLGTMAFPFATLYFGHAASTACLFTAFYLVWRWRLDPRDGRLIAAGALGGLAVITEIPVVIGVAVIGAYALWLARRRAVLFVLGGLPLLGVLLAYTTLAFDHPFSLGYQYTTAFSEQNSRGIVSIVWPTIETTATLLIGPRGLLAFAPWLALAPLGLVAVRGRLRAEVLVAAAMIAVFLTYNSGALNPLGGATPGPRYLMPALPIAAFLVGLAPRVVRPLALLLIVLSVAIFGLATITTPTPFEFVADPLREVWLPSLVGRDLAESVAWIRWGLHGLEPLTVLAGGVVLAAVGLVAAERLRDRGRDRPWPVVVIAAQAALVLAFAAPLPPVIPLAIATHAPDPSPVVIVDAGVDVPPVVDATRAAPRKARRATIWVQLESLGASLEGTRVTFSLRRRDGSRVWSAWYDEIDWQPGQRRRMRVDWEDDGLDPVTYRVGVAVTTPDEATVYVRSDDLATLTIGD
jgi:4-amino-4-deoxy-L-arabinose transferase-like glycosyltransferase